jgi:hypothetical protein
MRKRFARGAAGEPLRLLACEHPLTVIRPHWLQAVRPASCLLCVIFHPRNAQFTAIDPPESQRYNRPPVTNGKGSFYKKIAEHLVSW